MTIESGVHSNLPIPPGEYLQEVLDELAMTKNELARRMSRPAAKLSAIFKGQKAITPDTALQLEKVVGVPAHIWTGLEAEYRLVLARQQQQVEQRRLGEETKLVGRFCYAELAKRGFVKDTRKVAERVLELQKFLGVTALQNLVKVSRYEPAYRIGSHGGRTPSPEALAAWLRMGELQAYQVPCEPFSKERLEASLRQIRALTLQTPDRFEPALRRTLSAAGVALVACPHLPKTYANGATFWLGREKAVAMTTIRGGWADVFWFSLVHELGHIVRHGRHRAFIEAEGDDPEVRKQEAEANRFAEDVLIPRDKYKAFAGRRHFYKNDVRCFAEEVGVHPGIVVGRLQNDGHLERRWQNDLRMRFEWRE